MNKLISYLLSRADSVTAWIGFIGIVLQFLKLDHLLEILFLALIVLPEGNFSALFKNLTEKIKESIDPK